MMRQRQVPSQNCNTESVSMPIESVAGENAPFQPLANPPSCVTTLYAKITRH